MPAETEIRELVRRVVGRVLAERGREPHPAGHARPAAGARSGLHVDVQPASGPERPARTPAAPASGGGVELVTTECLAGTPDGGSYCVPSGARVTPLARDEAFRRGIRLVEGSSVSTLGGGSGVVRVAVGADHGGFALKRELIAWLGEAGYAVSDLGTHDENAVDYPDFARAVAEAVAGGNAAFGVCVDGAGIGSAMAANKVPGVRAANCWDVASANNAREHNYANVLTLGGKLPLATAFEILRTFLATAEGPERHARRVDKITAIEHRYTRSAGAAGSER